MVTNRNNEKVTRKDKYKSSMMMRLPNIIQAIAPGELLIYLKIAVNQTRVAASCEYGQKQFSLNVKKRNDEKKIIMQFSISLHYILLYSKILVKKKKKNSSYFLFPSQTFYTLTCLFLFILQKLDYVQNKIIIQSRKFLEVFKI